MRDPDFWAPIRKLSHEFADSLIARAVVRRGRRLNAEEETNLRFAVQVTFGTINNTILNRPGPVFMEQALFVGNLVRAFRLVSSYDELIVPTSRAQGRKPRRNQGNRS